MSRALLPLLGLAGAGAALLLGTRKASAAPGAAGSTPSSTPGTFPSPFPTPSSTPSTTPPSTTTPASVPADGFPATVIPPQSVITRIMAAMASGDPQVMRTEADKLDAEGWKLQARDLRALAVTVEAAQQMGAPPGTVPASFPAPAPAPSSAPVPSPFPTGATFPTPGNRPTLRKGSSGASVVELQQRLNSRGEKLTADGKFGALTEAAVKRFQTANGLKADGIVGPQTWTVLLASTVAVPTTTPATIPIPGVGSVPVPSSVPTAAIPPTIRKGSSGTTVVALQTRLNQLGESLTPDGKFGPATEAAVKRFQVANSLTADGVVGPKTWTALLTRELVAGDESDDAPEYDRRALQSAAAAMLMNVKSKPSRAGKSTRRYQRRAGIDQTGLYDVPTAFSVTAFDLVPELPLHFQDDGERDRWRAAMLQRAQNDPQRRDEWNARRADRKGNTMFGFAKKAFKKASHSVTHAVTHVPLVGDAVKAVPGRGFIRAGALLAAPGPVLSTAYTVKHPLKSAAIVATAGAAAPAVHGMGAGQVARYGAEQAAKNPAILSRGRPGDATRLIPALGAASHIVAATRNAQSRPAALKAILRTRQLARAGHHQAKVGMSMLQIAAQAPKWDRLGRVRIGSHYLNRFGRIIRAA